jgi:hypothetical protein
MWMNLISRYGPDRAETIIAGQDIASQADLTTWRRLGARKDGQ